ncbi:MAG: uracil-DNA glycosylase [Bacillota bacterium]|nr:MAG: uracil-DNA glycosylase [Bacillota bacterium]
MDRYEELVKEIALCKNCVLYEERNMAVAGSGSIGADLMLIGEGPGAEEDKNGVPFVGAAGRLLTDMLDAVDIDRDKLYVTNIVKCRPPKNRTPKDEEAAACLPYLQRQLEIIDPKVILLLGATALRYVLSPNLRITRDRGTWHQVDGRWIMATFHPAALLRDPRKKPDSFDDMVSLKLKIRELGLDV